MTIGIIIPTFNEEPALSLTLACILTINFDEVIVVDGGSQDGTKEIAESYLCGKHPYQGKVITSPRGRAYQMNAGAAESKADVFVFLHADTLLPPDAYQAIDRVLVNPHCIGGRFDVCFDVDQGYAWVVSRMMNLRSRWSGIATGDQAIFVRRSVFQQLGGFAEIPIMEDIEFTNRMKRLGQVAALRSKVTTSFRRWEQNGPLRTIFHMWTLRFLYWIGMSPHTLQKFYGTVR